jgi:hypothetical protein
MIKTRPRLDVNRRVTPQRVLTAPRSRAAQLVTLGLFALALAMFSRVANALGAPSMTNFAHFAFIPLLLLMAAAERNGEISKKFYVGCLAFGIVITASALLNGTGAANPVLEFLLLGEPFFLIAALTGTIWPKAKAWQYRRVIFAFVCAHLALAFFQRLVLGEVDDGVKGLFLNQGNGHHVGGAVSLAAGVYFVVTSRHWSVAARALFGAACLTETIFCDAKQVLGAGIVALVALAVIKYRSHAKGAAMYLVIAMLGIAGMFIAAMTVFPAMMYYLKEDVLDEGLRIKFRVIPLIIDYYHSPLNWLFGLGPGYTVSRLGTILPDYIERLGPLGATISPITSTLLESYDPVRYKSSLYAVTFSWAGIWGDLGFLGLGSYLYLGALVWRRLCVDDVTRFLVLLVVMLACITAWVDEPGFIVMLTSLIIVHYQLNHTSAESELTDSARVPRHSRVRPSVPRL